MSTEIALNSVEEAWRNTSFATSVQEFLDLQEEALKSIPQGATEIEDINDPEGYVQVSSGKHKITIREHIRRTLTEAFNRAIWTVSRDSLNADPDIRQSGEALGIEAFRRIVENNQGDLEFDLLADRVESWKERHCKDIASRFTHAKSDYTYTRRSKAGQVRVFYDCHHRGEKQVHKFRVIGGKSGKSRKRGESIKCGCPAKYSAVRKTMPMVAGGMADVCRIIYNYRHNHTLGDKEDVATLLKSEAVKARIRNLLNRNQTLQATMRRILMSYCDFFALPNTADAKAAQDSLISYNDIYQLWYDVCMDGAQKYPEEKVSAKVWMEELTKESYFTCCTQFDGLYYAFSSEWQLEQIKAHGSTIYFDGLHQIAGSSTSLYTILIRDGESDKGIPASFMITKAMDLPLSQWLVSLKEKLANEYQYTFEPKVIVTDQGSEEITTLKATFPAADILFCPWQALREWERNVPLHITASPGLAHDDRPELTAKALTALHAIAYEPSHLEAMTKVTAFRQQWTTCPELLEYLESTFLIENKMLKWMMCFRQGASASQTKADRHTVQVWHHQTKLGIFTYHKNQQSDWLITLLIRIVIPYYRDGGHRPGLANRITAVTATVIPTGSGDGIALASSSSTPLIAAPTTLIEHPSLAPQTSTDAAAILQAAVQEAVKEMSGATLNERSTEAVAAAQGPMSGSGSGSNATPDSSVSMTSEDRIGHLMSSIIELCGRRDITGVDDSRPASATAASPTAAEASLSSPSSGTAAAAAAAAAAVAAVAAHAENQTDSEPGGGEHTNHGISGSSGSEGGGASGDSVGFYANRLAELYTSRNVSQDFPQRKEVEQALKRCYELCAKYLAQDSSASEAKAKRQRLQE